MTCLNQFVVTNFQLKKDKKLYYYTSVFMLTIIENN